MCGRYSLRKPYIAISQYFSIEQMHFDFEPRYNIAPGQQVAVIRRNEDTRELLGMKWGLVPFWAEDARIGNKLINARAESAGEKAAFRQAYRRRRCLIPADGFYEWTDSNGARVPIHFRYPDNRLFAFAGLWEHWRPGETDLLTCTILTRGANCVVQPFHHRMPVIIDQPEAIGAWLSDTPPSLDQLMSLGNGDQLIAHPASRRVNNPRNEGPDCLIAD